MKKIALSILLVAALCLVALVAPVSAATNPANAGLNKTSPFWFPDMTYSSGKTLAAALPTPTAMNKLTGLSGKTVANSLGTPAVMSKLTGLSNKNVANSFPAITKVKYSTGGYFYF